MNTDLILVVVDKVISSTDIDVSRTIYVNMSPIKQTFACHFPIKQSLTVGERLMLVGTFNKQGDIFTVSAPEKVGAA